MSNLIETNAIEGFSIYGVQMVDYTSDGVSGRDFATAAVPWLPFSLREQREWEKRNLQDVWQNSCLAKRTL